MTVHKLRKAFQNPSPTVDLTAFVNSPQEYLENMKKPGVHADELFLRAVANVLDVDLYIIPYHPETASTQHGLYTRIAGGTFMMEESEDGGRRDVGINAPVFLAYFEETHFNGGGHYQAIEPFRNSNVLEDVKDRFGHDVAQIMSLPNEVPQFQPSANSTIAITPANKRRRSPSISPPPSVSPVSPDSRSSALQSLSRLREMIRKQGVTWQTEEVSYS